MGYPTLKGHLIIRSVITFNRLNVRFLFNSIEIFMQPINEETEKFLRIMLGIARKHRIDATNCRLNPVWAEDIVVITPHAFDKLCIRFS